MMTKIWKKCVLLMLGAMSVPPLAAHANMMVYPMQSNIEAGARNTGQLWAYSHSDKTQYVQVVVKRVLNPATQQEQEEEVKAWDGSGLIASPTKFALPAGGSRAVRLVPASTPTAQTVYRVYLEPVAAPGLDDTPATNKHGKVSVSIIWGAIVHVMPEQPIVQLAQDGGTLINTGTVKVRLTGIAQCRGAGQDACRWTDVAQSVYPGMRWSLPRALQGQTLRVRYLPHDAKTPQELPIPLADHQAGT
ncbi:fimbrial protein [Streptomyces cavourensis]|nr:fimbrial protein [Streptomyces cavourensis]